MPAGNAPHILRPVRGRTVAASFIAALVLEFLPWPDLRLVPDFAALVLVFWCIHEPRLIGLGTGWLVGLLVDAGNGVLLGQHALAYSVLAFLAVTFSRRIAWFGIWGQAWHVAGLLAAATAIGMMVRTAAGGQLPGWAALVGPLIGGLLWPAASWLLLLPQRRRERSTISL